jgi:drug/metabolite transporter (DMT)-like permease
MLDKFLSKSEHQKGVLSLILLSLVFASMGLFARYLSTGFVLLQQVYLRVLAAFILGLIFFWKDLNFKKLKLISAKEWWLLIFRSATMYLFGVTLFTQAIILTKYSNVSFIGALPMVAVLGIVLLKEKITIKKLILIISAFVGVVLIAVRDYSNIFSWGNGELIALISTIAFALSYIGRKWHTNLLNNKEITILTFFISFIMIFVTSIVMGQGIPSTGWNWGLFIAVLGAGLFNVINMLLTNFGFQKVEAILASNILTLESVFAIVLGFIFYKETPIAKELIGGFVITLSVLGMNKVEASE